MDRMPDIGVVSAVDRCSSARSGRPHAPLVAPSTCGRRARGWRTTGSSPRCCDGSPATSRRASSSGRSSSSSAWTSSTRSSTVRFAPLRHADAQAAAIGIGRVESPRGATTCIVEPDGDRVARLRLRTGSYANWPSVAHAAADELLPDFPLINKSFELCYACADR